MQRILLLSAPVALCALVLLFVPALREADAGPGDEDDRGRRLFRKHCAACHGAQGMGDGPAAYLLDPKPRNFARGEFRLITTTNGVPTDQDLLRVITEGMPGSAMPPWARLAEEDRLALVQEVKRLWRDGLRRRYTSEDVEPDEVEEFVREDTVPGALVDFEGQGDPTPARVARGRVLYFQACAPCHGPEGRGESEQELLDSLGRPAPARDFTKGIFKGGAEPRQLYARLRAGMRGSAMPQFGEGALTAEEAWSVVHYVRTLYPAGAQERQLHRYQTVRVHPVERIPVRDSEWWEAAAPHYLAVMPLWWRDERTEGVLVQAVHDGEHLAMRLLWEDATKDVRNLRHQDFHDGAAIQLSWDDDPPFFGMGDAEAAVAIWSWKASWQEDLEEFKDVESVYPWMYLDTYFPSQLDAKPGERPSRDDVSAPHHDARYLTGWGAKNPMSDPTRESAVETARAKGLGTLTTERPAPSKVQGFGKWDRGVWTLVVRAEIEPERLRGVHLALAVWNGSEGDRNGQKSVTIWHRMELE